MKRNTLFLITLCVIAVLSVFIGHVQAEEAGGDSSDKININTATIADFVKLKGVNLKYARRIMAYRNEHGPFQAPEDIAKVPGIGPRTWELNQNRIVVDGEEPAASPQNSMTNN